MTSAANQAALEAEHTHVVWFLYMGFAVEPFYICTEQFDIDWNSATWLGRGEIAGIGDMAEASDLAARQIVITMSGADSYITEPVNSRTNYKQLPVTIYKGYLDAANDLVDDPELKWQGRMDVGEMLYDKNYVAQVTCEPLAARLLRPNISRYSDQDHQQRWSGDKFFEYLPQMEKKDVTWGGRKIAPATNYGGGYPIGGTGRRIF
jgi:hypothetical protein